MQTASPLYFATLGEKIAILHDQGIDVIRLDIGSPDLPPAPHILEALSRAAQRAEAHGYQAHNATAGLRVAWAEMYERLYQVRLDPQREVLPLLGSKEGIFHLPLAVIDPGDVVLVPDPGYITYTQGALFAGGEPHRLPLLPERDFLPDLSTIPQDILKRARLLWLNYPSNPTAATASPEFFAEAVAFAREHNLLVCHDAAYSQVSFDGFQPSSLLQVPGAQEVAVEFNTLSKSHNMAGWRVGVALGHPEVLRALYNLKTNADSGHFLPVLEAATAAISGDQAWLRERNAIYQTRRDMVMQACKQLGWQAATPRASLYVWFHVPDGWDSEGFASAVLQRSHVSLTPGTVFGVHGEGYIRLSFTDSTERVAQAMDRLVKGWS